MIETEDERKTRVAELKNAYEVLKSIRGVDYSKELRLLQVEISIVEAAISLKTSLDKLITR